MSRAESRILTTQIKRLLQKSKEWEIWRNQYGTNVGQRKTRLSPRQESNPWPPVHRAAALSTELRELMESKVILLSSYVAGVLHTARISTVEFIMSSDKFIHLFIHLHSLIKE